MHFASLVQSRVVHLGVAVRFELFYSAPRPRLIPRWRLCALCMQTEVSVWQTRTLERSMLLLSEYRDAFTSPMQTERRTLNCALSTFWLRTGHRGCSHLSAGQQARSAQQCMSNGAELCIRPPLVITPEWPGLCMSIIISVCIYLWVYLFPSLFWQDFWWWIWMWIIHWN